MPCCFNDKAKATAEPSSDDNTDDGAKDGEYHRFGPDHCPHLSTLHPYRPEQTDLVGPFEHREHQRVHDSNECDDNGQGK